MKPWMLTVSAVVAAPTPAPWPKDKPAPPVDFATSEALRGVAADGALKAVEMACGWEKTGKAQNLMKGVAAAADLPEIQRTWRRGEVGKAGGMLVWTLLKLGCAPADAVDLAGKAMGAGMLVAKEATLASQLDAVYRSYKGSGKGGDRGVYGFRQGFLSGVIREDLRRQFPALTEAQLRRMEEAAVRTYCENRAYQEGFSAYKQEVRGWLGRQGIPWSGDEAALERFLTDMEAAEKLITARGAASGLLEAQRAALARALLRGGPQGRDQALASYFSQFYGDSRNARGDKLGPAPARGATAPMAGVGAGPAAGATKATGRWELVQTDRFDRLNPGDTAYRVSVGQGNIQMGWRLNQDVFQFTATWTPPPAQIRPTDRIPLDLALTVTENAGTQYSANGTFAVWIDRPECMPGSVIAPQGLKGDHGETGNFAASHRAGSPRPAPARVYLEGATLPRGRFALMVDAYNGRNAGVRYVYAWKE